MDPVTGATVMVGLGTLAKPTVQALSTIVGKMVGPSVDAIGQGIAAPLKVWAKRREERASATLIEAGQILHDAQIQPQPVPGRLLMPILEHASLEEDEELQHRWAALLANSATIDSKVLPAFVEILHQLTPVQANILQWMFEMKVEPDVPNWFPTWPDVARDSVEERFGLGKADYALLVTDLERLNLIEPRQDIVKTDSEGTELPMNVILHLVIARWSARVKYDSIGFTALGLGFIQACTPPK